MKFTLENAPGIQVHGYRPGELTLKVPGDDIAQPRQLVTYRSSVILSATGRVETWAISHVTELEPHHFEPVWQSRSEIVLLGTGEQLRFPSHEIRQAFAQKGIGFETMATAAACRTYNVLVAEGRGVTALLIIE